MTTRFERVVEILDRSVGGPTAPAGPHLAFWRNKTRDQLVALSVFNLPLIELGDGAGSNLVKALKGEPPFGTDQGSPGFFRRMPAGRAPVADEEIAFLEKWIDDGAPEDEIEEPGDEKGVDDIRELRILPPLAFARLGSATVDDPVAGAVADVMDNYRIVRGEAGGRSLEPAPTLRLGFAGNPPTVHVAEEAPPAAAVRFRGGDDRIRPVAPFFEVWARFSDDGPLEPLSRRHLPPEDVVWRVRAANRKVQRRTRAAGDADLVSADTGPFSDHGVDHVLEGRAANFLDGKHIPFSTAYYLEPTEEFPEIRLRLVPGSGRVYGFEENDWVVSDEQVVYDPARGSWQDYDAGLDPGSPVPGDTFRAGQLDDSCDGFVAVSIAGTELAAVARFTAGPPDFVPDHVPVRTTRDDLRQQLAGLEVAAPAGAEERAALVAEVLGIARGAFDTMRRMNTAALNVGYSGGAFPDALAGYLHASGRHQQLLAGLEGLASDDPVRFARGQAALQAIFGDRLRRYTQTFDFSPETRRKMPAMMRGSDAGDLVLTRRQVAVLEAARELPPPGAGPVSGPVQAMLTLIDVLAPIGAGAHFGIDAGGGRSLAELFDTPRELLAYLEAETAKGAAAGPVQRQPLVVPGKPDESAFFALITLLNPAMRSAMAATVPGTGKSGVEVVRDWILSLADDSD
jgi:hypothetical protein